MNRAKAYFTEGTTREYWIIGISIGMNIALIAFCMIYLVFEYRASGITGLGFAGALVIGYFFADFASGVVHGGIDTWFSEREFGRLVAMAREHHTHPQNILAYGF